MNVETLRDYCLSIAEDVVEKLPFAKIKGGETVLVFYVCDHMFCYFDIETFDQVVVKAHPDDILIWREQEEGFGDPSHMSAKHWVGLDTRVVADARMRELIAESYRIVKAKYTPKTTRKSRKNTGHDTDKA